MPVFPADRNRHPQLDWGSSQKEVLVSTGSFGKLRMTEEDEG
jgi:hypothetical protein